MGRVSDDNDNINELVFHPPERAELLFYVLPDPTTLGRQR